MKNQKQVAVAYVTAPDLKTARKLAGILLKKRLVACANLVPKIESHYWWRGQLEKSAEVLMILKTTGTRIYELQKTVLENHPYDTPEFIAFPVGSGSRQYLDWVIESVQAS